MMYVRNMPSFLTSFAGVLLGACMVMGAGIVQADEHEDGQQSWLASLITETPQEGFVLAVTLSQKGVATTQPDGETRKALRSE